MNIQLHSTDAMVDFNGVRCRVWEGISQNGVEVFALIPRIACKDNIGKDQLEVFNKELQEVAPPSNDAIRCFSLKQVI